MIQQLNQHTCRIFRRLYTDNPAFLPTGDARVDTESRQVCQGGSETFTILGMIAFTTSKLLGSL